MSLLYNMILIILCTVQAVKARKIPENFNEAKYDDDGGAGGDDGGDGGGGGGGGAVLKFSHASHLVKLLNM